MKSKAELRKEILTLRDALTVEERQEKSKRIAEKVIQHKKFKEADKLLLFASHKSEVDTTAIFEVVIQMGKEVYFPKVEGKEMEFYRVREEADLVEGYRGIREPRAEAKRRFLLLQELLSVDVHSVMSSPELPILEKETRILVIMPGVAFDRDGNRVGYGGGYYDKFLQRLEENRKEENLFKLAIAFQCQMIESGIIPGEAYDRKPNMIITEETEYIISNVF